MRGIPRISARSSWRFFMSVLPASCWTALSLASHASSRVARPQAERTHMAPYLKIDHIDKSFTRGAFTTDVLRDVSLDVAQGEFVSIIGHSGCGKTTLLNIVAGL